MQHKRASLKTEAASELDGAPVHERDDLKPDAVDGSFVAGQKNAVSDYSAQLAVAEARATSVQKSTEEVGSSATRRAELKKERHSEFATLSANKVAATELLKQEANVQGLTKEPASAFATIVPSNRQKVSPGMELFVLCQK